MSNQKCKHNILPAVILVIVAAALIGILLTQSSARIREQQTAINDLTVQLTAAQEANAALQADLDAANAVIVQKDEELAESAARLDAAESALNEALIIVQGIREGLALPVEEAPADGDAPAEEAPAEIPAIPLEPAEETPADEPAAEA